MSRTRLTSFAIDGGGRWLVAESDDDDGSDAEYAAFAAALGIDTDAVVELSDDADEALYSRFATALGIGAA